MSTSEESETSENRHQKQPLIPLDQLLPSRYNVRHEVQVQQTHGKELDKTLPLSTRVASSQPDTAGEQNILTAEVEGTTPEPILDRKLLEAIGKCLDAEKKLGPAIHNDILVRWKGILKEGLRKKERENIFNKYPVPENCAIIEPPELNPEVKASLLEPIIARDKRMVEKQKDVSLCLAAVGLIISNLLKGVSPDNTLLLTTLSDVSRNLVHLQRQESTTKRVIILAHLNAAMKDTLNATIMDEWLFGKELEATLKTAKLLECSSKELKPAEKVSTSSQQAKNWKGPPRQTTRGRGTTTNGQ